MPVDIILEFVHPLLVLLLVMDHDREARAQKLHRVSELLHMVAELAGLLNREALR